MVFDVFYLLFFQVTRKGWSHMECVECVLLEQLIKDAHRDPDLKKSREKDLEDHWDFQEEFRDHYSRTIVKAIMNDEFDLVVHVDGGTAGSEYSPYYYQDIIGEPSPHTTCKV
jgi:hypothetical protein